MENLSLTRGDLKKIWRKLRTELKNIVLYLIFGPKKSSFLDRHLDWTLKLDLDRNWHELRYMLVLWYEYAVWNKVFCVLLRYHRCEFHLELSSEPRKGSQQLSQSPVTTLTPLTRWVFFLTVWKLGMGKVHTGIGGFPYLTIYRYQTKVVPYGTWLYISFVRKCFLRKVLIEAVSCVFLLLGFILGFNSYRYA